MKSGKTIAALVALGAVATSSGVAVAQSGSSGSGSAAGVQYQQEQTRTEQIAPAPQQEVLPAEVRSPPAESLPVASAEVTPAAEQPQRAAAVPAQAGNELPFTGFDAMAVALGGVALLLVGLLLRRRTRHGA